MVALWVALGIFALVAAIVHGAITTLADADSSVERSHAVIGSLLELRIALAEAEAARRAHALTGDEARAEDCAHAIERLTEITSAVRELSADNPGQQRRIDEMSPLLESRAALLREGIAWRRAYGVEAEQRAPTTRKGVEIGEEVRLLVATMVDEERRLLDERRARTAASTSRALIAQIAGTCLGAIVLVVAFLRLRREIRLRVLSERAVRQSEESLSTTLHSIGDAVIATDVEGRITRMNPIAEQLTGWSGQDAAGRPSAEVFHIVREADGEPAVNPIEEVLRDGRIVALANHTALVAKDGARLSIADSAAPIRDADGRLAGVVLVFRDVTADRIAEQKLHDANAFLDSILDNLPSMIFVKGAGDLRFQRFNRAGEVLLGASRDSLIGKSDFDLFPEEQATFFTTKDREVLLRKKLVDIPEELIDTPKGRRWLHTKKIPILDEEGRPAHLLGISEDITERKEIADELRRAHDELELRVAERTAEIVHTNSSLLAEIAERKRAEAALVHTEEQLRQSQKMDAIGRLAGGIAHDFNNLLSVILSYGALLLSELGAEDPIRADLEEITKAGKRAADLTRQLLAFSRQQVLAPKLVDLQDTITGMSNMLRRVIGEDVELRTVTSPHLGKVKVDPGQIEQVIMNLAVNARDAMPQGGVLTIETAHVDIDAAYASEHEGASPGPHVMLAVTDTGEGMDRATQERVFEPFFTTKPQGKGTGLGLSTVFGIVKQSGGSIWVYSEPQKGTAFKIYLPRVLDRSESGPHRLSTIPASTGAETILLVEDEDQVRAVARSILSRKGYRVIEARSAEEALDLWERFSGSIHLVVTDVVMPRMSGRVLAERLAALRPGVKVLFMSGYTDDTVVYHGVLDAGFAFLQKPLTPDALTRKVREVLDEQK